MKILGIETSCDECAAAVVEDGGRVLGNVVASQIEEHRPYYGVVPEIASRKHLEWIVPVVKECLEQAGLSAADCDAVAATYRPGLIGSLLVGLSFGKGLAAALKKPFIGIDHVEAHLYAPRLEREIPYPYVGVLVSGGHTMISLVRGEDELEVLGTTIDDACGECFDKVAKHYDFGYPGGAAVDRLAQKGDPRAFHFPKPSLHKGDHTYDVSYLSGSSRTSISTNSSSSGIRNSPKRRRTSRPASKKPPSTSSSTGCSWPPKTTGSNESFSAAAWRPTAASGGGWRTNPPWRRFSRR